MQTSNKTSSLPAELEAEQMLLGAILSNNKHINDVSEFLLEEHFIDILHQKIYRAILFLTDKGSEANIVTIKSILYADNLFCELGGDDYLGKLAALSLTVIEPLSYGKLIYDLAIKRKLIAIGSDIASNARYRTELDATEQIEQAENNLHNLASLGVHEKSFIDIAGALKQSINNIDKAMRNAYGVIGIPTLFTALDDKLSGFHNSDLVIIAGRPSMGKTAFALNLAINCCKSIGERNAKEKMPGASVGFFSLEMSCEQLTNRLISMYSEIDSKNLRSGKLQEADYNKIKEQIAVLKDLPFFIDDTAALTISAIRTRARKLKRKSNLGLLFVDYLQLIRGTNKSNRVQEISEITQGLKALAKELNIPVIALSQLSRAVEMRADKRPMLSDLRESGAIEQDADVVMFIYREEYYLSRSMPKTNYTPEVKAWESKVIKCNNQADIIIAKHRNGPVGTVKLSYNLMYSKFNNLY